MELLRIGLSRPSSRNSLSDNRVGRRLQLAVLLGRWMERTEAERPPATSELITRTGFPRGTGTGLIYLVLADSDLGDLQSHQIKFRNEAASYSLASFVARCAKRHFRAATAEIGIGGANRGEKPLHYCGFIV